MGLFEQAPIGQDKAKIGEQLRDYFEKMLTYDWIFSKWYEKLIVVALLIFAIYRFVMWVIL